jgi:starch phosphorylase
MVRVSGPDARPLTITLELSRRVVRLAVWRVDVGRVPLYLLDADGEENDPIDRWITARLYVGDRRIRIAQYAVLGIGGVRALQAMGIRPSIVHLNEGHGAFANLERIRLLLAADRGLDDAIAATRATTAFTTHTPVAAGNETYDAAEIDAILGDYLDGFGVPRATIHDIARARPDGGVGLTVLALRTSGVANGVSRRHGEVARTMWRSLWPERPASDVPIGHVTNGVHTGSWMGAPMAALLDRHLGPRWRERPADPGVWDAVEAIPDAELWQTRCALRRELVGMVRERSVRDRLGRGEPLEYVAAAAGTFDDQALTIGFARRMATYKRFYLLTREAGRGLHLLDDVARPIQLVVAGRAHPQDEEAKNALRDLFQIKRAPAVGKHVAFLEDYDLHLAPRIVAGVDLWLNLPRPPLEASGTSGMKVTLNGGLNLSVLDGWWIEGFDARLGWGVDSPDGDPQAQDAHDVQVVFDLLEREIIPLFYARGPDGVPHAWLARIKHAMRTLIPRFAADRMLRDYVANVYAPLLAT